MARRKTTSKFASSSSSTFSSTRLCAICSETAIGVNFSALTCMSCKAFFRRHARNEKEKLKCPFVGQCPIDQVTRKFCAKCRLAKCFRMGMKKDHILTEEQRQKMREKIAQNRLLREQLKTPKRKRKSSVVSNSSSASNGSTNTSSSSSASTLNEDHNSIVVEYIIKQQSQQADEVEESQDPCNISVLGPDSYFPSLIVKSEFDDAYIGGSGGSGNYFVDPFLDEYCNDLLGEELFKEPFPTFSSSEPSPTSVHDQNFHQNTQPNEPKPPKRIKIKEDPDHDFIPIRTSPLPPPPSSNFLLSYLNSTSSSSSSSPFNELNSSLTLNRDPVVESLSPVANPQSVYGEIGFSPSMELLLPEKCLLQELTAACTVLQNSYTRLETVVDAEDTLVRLRAGHLSACLFSRLAQMATRLDAFRRLNTEDQTRMLQGRQLLEMAAIRSVLLYDEYRDAWCVFDDKEKTSVFLKLDSFAHFCTAYPIERHKAFPRLFAEEFKRDSIIFDLLTAMLLFTPRPEYLAGDEIAESYSTYSNLLLRYLHVKYASSEEAQRSYAKLQANLEEMRALNEDVQNFFQGGPPGGSLDCL